MPTRELADQVAQQVKLYANRTPDRRPAAVAAGGARMKPRRDGIQCWWKPRQGCWTNIEAKNAVLNQVEYAVLTVS